MSFGAIVCGVLLIVLHLVVEGEMFVNSNFGIPTPVLHKREGAGISGFIYFLRG